MQSYRIILIVIILASLIGYGVGYIFIHPDILGVCEPDDYGCLASNRNHAVADTLLPTMPHIAVIAIILLFLSNKIFEKWWRFGLIYAFFATLAILATPVTYSGLIGSERDDVARFLAWGFTIISLIIIIVKFINLRRQGRTVD